MENNIEKRGTDIIHRLPTGQCHVFVGPMWSGKTTRLLGILTRIADSTPCNVLRVSYAKDIRKTVGVDSENCVTTHNSQFRRLSEKVNVQIVNKLSEVNSEKYDVIGIDEAQFYAELPEYVKTWVLNDRKLVYVASLDAYSDGSICGQVTKLLPFAQTFVKMTAICAYCMENRVKTPAVITVCKVRKRAEVQIGGHECYSPACLECHKLHNKS